MSDDRPKSNPTGSNLEIKVLIVSYVDLFCWSSFTDYYVKLVLISEV